MILIFQKFELVFGSEILYNLIGNLLFLFPHDTGIFIIQKVELIFVYSWGTKIFSFSCHILLTVIPLFSICLHLKSSNSKWYMKNLNLQIQSYNILQELKIYNKTVLKTFRAWFKFKISEENSLEQSWLALDNQLISL